MFHDQSRKSAHFTLANDTIIIAFTFVWIFTSIFRIAYMCSIIFYSQRNQFSLNIRCCILSVFSDLRPVTHVWIINTCAICSAIYRRIVMQCNKQICISVFCELHSSSQGYKKIIRTCQIYFHAGILFQFCFTRLGNCKIQRFFTIPVTCRTTVTPPMSRV